MKGSPQTRGHSTTITIAKRKKIKQIPHTYRPTYPLYPPPPTPHPPPPSPYPYLPFDVRPIRYRYKIKKKKTEKKKFYLLFFWEEEPEGGRKLHHAVYGRSLHHGRVVLAESRLRRLKRTSPPIQHTLVRGLVT
jgi:hypothetical protein